MLFMMLLALCLCLNATGSDAGSANMSSARGRSNDEITRLWGHNKVLLVSFYFSQHIIMNTRTLCTHVFDNLTGSWYFAHRFNAWPTVRWVLLLASANAYITDLITIWLQNYYWLFWKSLLYLSKTKKGCHCKIRV